MKLNKEKCGMLNLRKRNMKNTKMKLYNGIPEVAKYKYLGIIFL
jgi:hypothetical protein